MTCMKLSHSTTTRKSFLQHRLIPVTPKKIQVTATDGDKDREQKIVYFLTGQGIDPDNPANSKFDINRTTGEIYVLKVLIFFSLSGDMKEILLIFPFHSRWIATSQTAVLSGVSPSLHKMKEAKVWWVTPMCRST